MNDLSNEDLIKALPLDESEKTDLLKQYNEANDGKKFEILRICWKAFHSMRRIMTEVKHNEFLNEIAQGTRELTSNLADEVEEAVWNDIQIQIQGKKSEVDRLEEVRRQLHEIIQSSTH